MNYERKFILTQHELKEMMMSAWVDGWYNEEKKNDDGKKMYAVHKIGELIDEVKE